MKLFLLFFLATILTAAAQPSPYRVLRPIMPDPNNRQAPSSVRQQDLQPSQPQPDAAVKAAPPKPTQIVAKIDDGLAISKITLTGRVTGIKGAFYVTNFTSDAVEPHLQFAVCDRNGVQIGVASKIGSAVTPYNAGRMDVVATNVGGVDLKLMKLSAK